MKFSEQRLESSRNFMNKIWNATRFCLNYLKDFKPPAQGVNTALDKSASTTYDQWIVFQMKLLQESTESLMAQNRFSDAANAIYSFVWYEFCDWYIEFIKPIVNGPDGAQKPNALLNMAQILNRIMRLLHPFTPFVTEEIYQKLPIKGAACIIDQYPTIKTDKQYLDSGSEQASDEIELIKAVIVAVRNIRGENKIKAGSQVSCKIKPSNSFVENVMNKHKVVITQLSRIDDLIIGDTGNLSKCAVTNVTHKDNQALVVIPLAGIVDLDEEIKRIQKNIEKLDKDISSTESRLKNENFVKNAAEEVIEADRLLLSQSKVKVKSLKESLERLQS
jgi:valyl-tRNA synthetase